MANSRDGPVAVANVPPLYSYDNFQMRSAPIQANYSYKHQLPQYKAGGEVFRPKSSIKGRKWKGNYDHITKPSHPDFYPIYGPQGDKRRQNTAPRESYRREKTPQKKKKENTTSDYREPERKPQEGKEYPYSREKQPRSYYNEPDTKDRYREAAPNEENQRESPRKEQKLQKDSANDKEKTQNYLDNKQQEKPKKTDDKKEPVITELYQSNLKKKPQEANKDEPTENKRAAPKQEREEVKRAANEVRDDPVVQKNRENPEGKTERAEPVVAELHQSKLKKKPQEGNKDEYKENRNAAPKQEREEIRKTENKVRDDLVGNKNTENPERKTERTEPVIAELHQSRLRKQTTEPNKDKQKEEAKPKREKENDRQEDKENKEPVYTGYKDEVQPVSKNDRVDPLTKELHQSKLRQAKEEPNKITQKEVKPVQKEEIKPVQKEEVKPVQKEEVKPVQKEEVKPVKKDEEDVKKDKEKPARAGDGREPVILDPYRSKLKERPGKVKEKQKDEVKPPPKQEEKKEMKENVKEDKEVVKVEKKEDEKEEETKPRMEDKKKDVVTKEEPVKKVEKKDPYAYTKLYEDQKPDTPKDEPVQPKETLKKTEKPDPYLYRTDEDPRKNHKNPNRERPNRTVEKDTTKPRQEKEPTPKSKGRVVEVYSRVPRQRTVINSRDKSSVRARYYEQADMDDVIQDKVATQLRQNGISETRVVPLSAKITQAVRDDVIDASNKASPQVTSNLKEVINKHLDPILFNSVNATDLKDSQKPSDARQLSNLVLLRMGQVHEELDLCRQSVDDPKNKHGKGQTPRDTSQDRSMIMTIKDSLKKQKTENEILRDKLRLAQKETHEVANDKEMRQEKLENMDADNWQLKKDCSETEREKQNLLAKVKEQQKDYIRLDKQHQEVRQENVRLKNKVNENEIRSQNLSADMTKLLSENARLKVLADQKEKEILHLRDPDQDMVHQIKILTYEVTLLRTQTCRLKEEKGILKSRSQKLESSLDESYKQKHRVSLERDNLHKENEDLKQRYRKLALANPQQRTLPDINSGHNGPSSRANSRANSRAHSRNVRSTDDRKMSTAHEEDEDAGHGR